MTATNEMTTTVSEYLHGTVLESEELENFLNALTRLAVHELSIDGQEMLCGITVLRHKRAGTVASSSEAAQELDEVQYTFDDGPCLTASRAQALVRVTDLATDGRWPHYAKHVTGRGIRSVLAVPFDLEAGDGAALNFYSSHPDAFSDALVGLAQEYVREASQAFAVSLRLARHREAEADALKAMKARTTIDVAVGIIMGQTGCSQDKAMETLKSASSSRNIKLRDVAAGLVRSGFGKEPATHFDR